MARGCVSAKFKINSTEGIQSHLKYIMGVTGLIFKFIATRARIKGVFDRDRCCGNLFCHTTRFTRVL